MGSWLPLLPVSERRALVCAAPAPNLLLPVQGALGSWRSLSLDTRFLSQINKEGGVRGALGVCDAEEWKWGVAFTQL